MPTVALAFLKKFWPYILAALLVIAAVIWWDRYIASVEAKGYFRGYDKATAEATAEKLTQLEVNQKAFAALVSDKEVLSAKLTANDDKHQKKLKDAQYETNRLRNLGSGGLHINALCPTAGPSTQAASYPSLDIGTGAKLDTSARQAYFDLRDGINQVEAKLAACQGELRLRQ